MPTITLITRIRASVEICFDLARSIDLHMYSVSHTSEKAVDGVVTGLIGANQDVTWRAQHFGVWLSLTSEITAFDRPRHFRDSMKRGPFKRFGHDHFFEFTNGLTVMRDEFDYNSPLGLLGCIVDTVFLKRYLTALLTQRNAALKRAAETNPEMFLPTDHKQEH